MATGDVVAARAMFLRAAETEDPEAALALGAAYDPHVLRRLGVIGIVPDLEKARAWYGKAERLGSIDARYRLENLKR
jgi:TPR repeat protein